MRRRWSRAAVLACLVLLAAAACVAESRAVPAAGTGSAAAAGGGGRQRGAFDVVVVGLVSIGLGRRWRAGGGEMVDEDKRRVPTGPNPLHNR